MQVTRKNGKQELTVSGTEEQIARQIQDWMRETAPGEEFSKLCAMIREAAARRKIPGAKDASILLVAQEVLSNPGPVGAD